jgi:hypothetical protein
LVFKKARIVEREAPLEFFGEGSRCILKGEAVRENEGCLGL